MRPTIFLALAFLAMSACVSYGVQYARVTGNSMSGILRDGQLIAIYPVDRDVRRGDLVVYPWAGRKIPLVKRVLAIAGDTLKIEPTKGAIIINGVVAKTTYGHPYGLNERNQRVLALYQGVIPKGAVLVMGNLPEGTNDGTRFGLIPVAELIGVAVK